MMQLLKTAFHPDISPADIAPDSGLTLIVRHATRAIVLRGEDILLLYTQHYDDYSLPGGGIAEGEDQVAGLIRELQEETGAQGIRNVKAFARYDEYRPWYKADADIIHITNQAGTRTFNVVTEYSQLSHNDLVSWANANIVGKTTRAAQNNANMYRCLYNTATPDLLSRLLLEAHITSVRFPSPQCTTNK